MANLPPNQDPAAQAAANDAAEAGVGGGFGGGIPPAWFPPAPQGAGGGPPDGIPPPQLGALPLASPSPIAMAIWAKKPEAERMAFSTNEMRNCRAVNGRK
jgi:hypothetical protein